MKRSIGLLLVASVAAQSPAAAKPSRNSFGRVEVGTVPLPTGLILRTATYTPSGKILVSYSEAAPEDSDFVRLATMDDDGANFRPFFADRIISPAKHNGIRYMVFADNRRILTGDHVIECTTPLESCDNPELLPVIYSAQVADGPHIANRWSEIIPAPDNRRIAWTTLLANFSAMVFVGELRRERERYVIDGTQIVSTLNPFSPDPRHPDGMLVQSMRGGEVKQFVRGGAAISLAGAVRRDLAGSVVYHLDTGQLEPISDPPGYTETTIFSPDERLGITMTARFSERTDIKAASLLPRPYPDSLNMGLSMFAYMYSVAGVRGSREGSIGPALIDIRYAKSDPEYLGVDLMRDPAWVFRSPMSWHPGGKAALWLEGARHGRAVRMQRVYLPDYRPAAPVRVRPAPAKLAHAVGDLSMVPDYAKRSQDIDVKVYGRRSGQITYRRRPDGGISKTYANFSDDRDRIYNGTETMQANPRGTSTYMADVRLSGRERGAMKLKLTFGPIEAELPAKLIFDSDATGVPLTHGFAEYRGQRVTVDNLLP